MITARLTSTRNEEFAQPSFNLSSDSYVVLTVVPTVAGIPLMTS